MNRCYNIFGRNMKGNFLCIVFRWKKNVLVEFRNLFLVRKRSKIKIFKFFMLDFFLLEIIFFKLVMIEI